MNNLSDKKLIQWNALGLIPGPEENENDFLERANDCLTLKDHLEEQLGHDVPFAKERPAEHRDLREAFQKTRQCYGIVPEWIPVFYSNAKLSPWHGGCAWIFQVTENSPKAALLQLRRAFRSSKRYLGMYHRDELIAHELSHVGRMAFEEPKFEEFLAYRSSESRFRRWFGPIVQSAWESMSFVLALLMIFLFDAYLIATGHDEAYQMAMWLKGIPLGMVVLGMGRLFWRHWTLNTCFRRLQQVVTDKKAAQAILYRLTDREIIAFSRQSPQEIRQFITKNKDQSLRWRLLSKAYFLYLKKPLKPPPQAALE